MAGGQAHHSPVALAFKCLTESFCVCSCGKDGNGLIILAAMERKYWVLRCKVCHRWHKGDLVTERERLLDLAPTLRKTACPDRPREWASYSPEDWKQMTEAEWNALPELLDFDRHAA